MIDKNLFLVFGFGWLVALAVSPIAFGDEKLLNVVENAADDPSVAERIQSRDQDGEFRTVPAHEPNDVRWVCEPDDDFRLLDDIHSLPGELWSDAKSLVRFDNAVILGVGGGLAAISGRDWDQSVRDDVAEHPRRWGGFNNLFDVIGHPVTQAGAASILYASSLISDDPEMHDFTKSLLQSLMITDASTLVLQYSFDQERPNGDPRGFPSGHVASSFAFAAVVEKYHGWGAGLAAYSLAGLVAWHRVDDQKHNLSDVIFGATLGYVVGSSIGRNHLMEQNGIHVGVYSDPARHLHGLFVERSY